MNPTFTALITFDPDTKGSSYSSRIDPVGCKFPLDEAVMALDIWHHRMLHRTMHAAEMGRREWECWDENAKDGKALCAVLEVVWDTEKREPVIDFKIHPLMPERIVVMDLDKLHAHVMLAIIQEAQVRAVMAQQNKIVEAKSGQVPPRLIQ